MSRQFCYKDRANFSSMSIARDLFILMDEKKTNLCISADFTKAQDVLTLAETMGDEICVLKTHVDILQDFQQSFVTALKQIAHKKRFLIFEDRKFADIGHTVREQYRGGIYQIAKWANMVNAHSVAGAGVIKGLQQNLRANHAALILIADLSSSGNFMDEQYRQHTLQMANTYPQEVIGFITQHAPSSEAKWINFTPGVQIDAENDAYGQRYRTPEKAILEHGADVIIVGRGITAQKDPLASAKIYRERGYQAYLDRLNRLFA